MKSVIKTFEEFISVPSTVGNEKNFLELLNKKFKDINYETRLANNHLSVKSKNPSKIVFAVHADRIGLIKTEFGWEQCQYAMKRKRNMKINSNKLLFAEMAKRFSGKEVFSYDKNGKKLSKGKVLSGKINLSQKRVVFDVESSLNKSNARVLEFAYQGQTSKSLVQGQLDNALVCALVYELVRKHKFNGHLIFTTEEEIGRSWKQVVEYSKKNKIKKALILDISSYESMSQFKNNQAIIRIEDDFGKYDLDLVAKLKETCKSNNIPHIIRREYPSKKKISKRYTDVSKIMHFSSIKSAAIQLPTIKNHTNNETTSIQALKNYYDILKLLLTTFSKRI